MHIIKVFLLVTIAVWLACCNHHTQTNQNAEPAVSASSFEPCSLITREEVSTVLDQQVTAATAQNSPRPNCRYTVGDGSVTVFAFTDNSAAGAFQTGKRMQDSQTESMSEVGDQAYWSPSIKTLNVLKGKVYFTVQFYGVPSGSKETMKILAQKAVARIP